ncbi:MAG: hypothetical protein CL916_05345 [Deltaproteobacteria bacterium]|nr:hypothetical protein [Deltaproteobacteria bacterium]
MLFFFIINTWAMNPFEEVECPLGKDYARVFSFSSQNQLGGYDSDLASYAKGEQFRTFAISTCYDNYFSLYGQDFDLTLTEEQQSRVQETITNLRSKLIDPKNPLVWERYEIAAEIYRNLNRPPHFIAQVYIEASWTVRDSFVGFHQGLNGPKSAQEILDLGPKELQKTLSPDQKKILVFNLARVAQRAGYPKIRDMYLNKFESLSNLSDSDKKGLRYIRNIAIPKEQYYQEKARTELLQAVQNMQNLSDSEKYHTQYLLADLHRRLGDSTLARPLYEKVRAQSQDERLVDMSDFFLTQ